MVGGDRGARQCRAVDGDVVESPAQAAAEDDRLGGLVERAGERAAGARGAVEVQPLRAPVEGADQVHGPAGPHGAGCGGEPADASARPQAQHRATGAREADRVLARLAGERRRVGHGVRARPDLQRDRGGRVQRRGVRHHGRARPPVVAGAAAARHERRRARVDAALVQAGAAGAQVGGLRAGGLVEGPEARQRRLGEHGVRVRRRGARGRRRRGEQGADGGGERGAAHPATIAPRGA